MNFEERIEEAIVARFFEPSWMVTPHYVMDPQTGKYRSESVNEQIPAPMTVIAEAIYKQAQDRILQKAMAQLDIDAIVAEWAPIIAKGVVAQLQKENDRWSAKPGPQARKEMLDKVYDLVAVEFGRQCVEHLKNTGGLVGILESSE